MGSGDRFALFNFWLRYGLRAGNFWGHVRYRLMTTVSSEPRGARLLAISSGGGHWIELARLSAAFDDHDVLYASTAKNLRAPSGNRNVSEIRDASRSDPVRLVGLLWDVVHLLISFRPRVIVTTGAAPGLLAIVAGKLMGCRSVWIDSVANAETLSLSGRLTSRWADVRLTQWPHLACQRQRVSYIGSVL
jgi:UDP-N-acetylglucosamine:LPS N-acetylglucosamine transferase